MADNESRYTFGDQGPAAERLRRLAALYERLSEAALQRAMEVHERSIATAIDLGAGPGFTTELVARVSGAPRVIGFERSAAFCREARARAPAQIEFVEQDVASALLAVGDAELAFCRFLLTHLVDPMATLASWRKALRPGGILVLIELENLSSTDPVLSRYYEIIEGMQAHNGQRMHIGGALDEFARQAGYEICESRAVETGIPASAMATLHRPNLENVRQDAWVRLHVSDPEIEAIATGLERIAAERDGRTPIENRVRVVLARNPSAVA